MKVKIKSFLAISLFLFFVGISCTPATDDEWLNFEGTYEALSLEEDKLVEIIIVQEREEYSWFSAGSGLQPIILKPNNRFEVPLYAAWGYMSQIEGRLDEDRLITRREVFEMSDLDNPILVSVREFIRKK